MEKIFWLSTKLNKNLFSVKRGDVSDPSPRTRQSLSPYRALTRGVCLAA